MSNSGAPRPKFGLSRVLLHAADGTSRTDANTWVHGMHWFGHKASNSQRYWVMDPKCRRARDWDSFDWDSFDWDTFDIF